MATNYRHAEQDMLCVKGLAGMYAFDSLVGWIGTSGAIGALVYSLFFAPYNRTDVTIAFAVGITLASVTVYFECFRRVYKKELDARTYLHEFLCTQLLNGTDGVNWKEVLAQELRFGRPVYVVANEVDQLFRDRYIAYVRQRYAEALKAIDDTPADKRNRASGQKWVDEIAKFEQSYVGQVLRLGLPVHPLCEDAYEEAMVAGLRDSSAA